MNGNTQVIFEQELLLNSIFVILLLSMVSMEKEWNFKNLDVIAFPGKIYCDPIWENHA